jgi:hypothetical protein
MSDHWIRLRGGWRADRETPAGPPGWVALPLPQPPWPDPPAALRRAFHAPPIDADREAVWLRLERTAGLRAVRLNGATLVAGTTGPGVIAVRLPVDLPARSLLELEPEPDFAPPADAGEWGRVALVIRDAGAFAGELGDPGEGHL